MELIGSHNVANIIEVIGVVQNNVISVLRQVIFVDLSRLEEACWHAPAVFQGINVCFRGSKGLRR
jgi:hypothetical protein